MLGVAELQLLAPGVGFHRIDVEIAAAVPDHHRQPEGDDVNRDDGDWLVEQAQNRDVQTAAGRHGGRVFNQ